MDIISANTRIPKNKTIKLTMMIGVDGEDDIDGEVREKHEAKRSRAKLR